MPPINTMRIKKLLTHYFEFRHILFVAKIAGESMWPALIPGQQYLATNLVPIRIGDFAVFRNSANPQEFFVKRVCGILGDAYRVESLVSWGASSHDFGYVTEQNVIGKLLRFRREVRPSPSYRGLDRTS